jgi:competence protein ComEC
MWYFPQVTWLAFAMLIAGVSLSILPGIWPLRLVGILLCLPAFANRPAPSDRGGFELAILDVGQGLAVVVSTNSHVLVYDTGPGFRTGRDTGELVVLPYLRHRGIREVDMLMVSHGDLDHQGGMNSIVKGMPTETLVVGPSVHYAAAAMTRCRAGQRWVWDDVSFEVLHPQEVASVRDNDSSCVLRIQANAASALLTGDIEQEGEAALVSSGLRQADIVVVPHHGSRSSSTSEFIKALAPRIAVFSAGYRNRWGFPKSDVVARWQASHARTYSTIDSGAIEIRIASDGATRVREYRGEQRRYWSRRSADAAP